MNKITIITPKKQFLIIFKFFFSQASVIKVMIIVVIQAFLEKVKNIDIKNK